MDQEVENRGEDGERSGVGGDVEAGDLRMAEDERDAEIANMPVFEGAGGFGVFAEGLAAEEEESKS